MGSDIRNAFIKLEIEYTDDLGEVKEAYSRKIAECHPEENPDEWRQVHDAFISIKSYLEENPRQPLEGKLDQRIQMPEESAYDFGDKNPYDYSEIDRVIELGANEYAQQNKLAIQRNEWRKYRTLLRKMNGIISDHKLPDGGRIIYRKVFMVLHNHEQYMEAMTFPIFVKRLTDMLSVAMLEPDLIDVIENDINLIKENQGIHLDEYDSLLAILCEKRMPQDMFLKKNRSAKLDNARRKLRADFMNTIGL